MNKKIKIYCMYTHSYGEMIDLFKQSFEVCKDNFELHLIRKEEKEKTGYLSFEFTRMVFLKTIYIQKTIKENLGDFIIWSDCDILFVKNIYDEISSLMQDCDIGGIGYEPEIYLKDPRFKNYINICFFLLKCTPELLSFWLRVVRRGFYMIKYTKSAKPLDERAFNEVLHSTKHQFKCKFLPDPFFHGPIDVQNSNYLRELKNSKKLIHFAGVQNCLSTDRIDQKIEGMKNYIKANSESV